jgi:hypothetical protein
MTPIDAPASRGISPLFRAIDVFESALDSQFALIRDPNGPII